MPWLQLKLQTTQQYAENIGAWLHLLGAVAVTLQDAADEPILEPALDTTPIWSQTYITGLFDAKTNIDKILDFLHTQLEQGAILHHQIEPLPEQDWELAWRVGFHPMHFGQKLWVCPSMQLSPDPNAINIILEPGLAFGTGTHPTTALCLEWLDAHPPQNELVIDYGCGSGILAIAALKLGAREVWAVDHDPQALEATLNNAERNQINKVSLKTVYPKKLPTLQADTLLANILANPLIELSAHFADLVKPKGNLVLSGILTAQIEMVSQAYQLWFDNLQSTQLDGWVRLEGKRK